MTVKCNSFPDGKKILSIISSMFRLKEIVDIILIIFWKRFFLIAAVKFSELLEGLSPMLGSWWCDWMIYYICSFDRNLSFCKITSPFCLLLVLCLISAMRIKSGLFPNTKNIYISVVWEKKFYSYLPWHFSIRLKYISGLFSRLSYIFSYSQWERRSFYLHTMKIDINAMFPTRLRCECYLGE